MGSYYGLKAPMPLQIRESFPCLEALEQLLVALSEFCGEPQTEKHLKSRDYQEANCV